MSSGKKVHYDRGTKGASKSHHRSSGSRDSGVGSSSASDRASLGTSPESPFSHGQLEDQRRNLGAVQGALDAAMDQIRELKSELKELSLELSDSNGANRKLKSKNVELTETVEALRAELDYEKKLRREVSSRTGPEQLTSKSERRTPPRRTEPREGASRRELDVRSQGSRDENRPSRREPSGRPPLTTQALDYDNPFTPRPTPGRRASVSYSSANISYAPSSVTWAPAAQGYGNAQSPASPSDRYPNDGSYHPYPL